MRRIISLAFRLHPKTQTLRVSTYETASLDDADIIIMAPPPPPYAMDSFEGLPCLGDYQSFQYKRTLNHWRSELANALSDGKTLVVMAYRPSLVFAATGEKKVEGTARSPRITRVVAQVSSWDCLPITLPHSAAASGSLMKILPKAKIIASYWRQFGSLSSYQVRFDQPEEGSHWRPLVSTGASRVAALLGTFKGGGHVLFLPPCQLTDESDGDQIEYEEEHDDEDELEEASTSTDDPAQSDLFRQRSLRLVEEILAIDAHLKGDGRPTPPPSWAGAAEYSTPRMNAAMEAVTDADARLLALHLERETAATDYEQARLLQELLYGKGTPLELAVLRALRLMGFDAEQYSDAENEFDAVFSYSDTRMLGEAEGRDNSPIAVDKITQLCNNLDADFAREDVLDYAKGVLFGNPQRLLPPSQRTLDFTQKCRSIAERRGIALVLTPSMFAPAAYLEHTQDKAYAQACREAICSTSGAIVQFPAPRETPANGCKDGPKQGTVRTVRAKRTVPE